MLFLKSNLKKRDFFPKQELSNKMSAVTSKSQLKYYTGNSLLASIRMWSLPGRYGKRQFFSSSSFFVSSFLNYRTQVAFVKKKKEKKMHSLNALY